MREQVYNLHSDPLETVNLLRRCPRETFCMQAQLKQAVSKSAGRRAASLLFARSADTVHAMNASRLDEVTKALGCDARWEGPGWCSQQGSEHSQAVSQAVSQAPDVP